MAITKFKPIIWSSKILTGFRENAIFAGLANSEYTGDAKSGSTVRIVSAVDVAVKDYKANGRTTSADDITDTSQDLLIDQEKNFDFYVDDIDRAQAAGNLSAYTESAAAGLVEDADKFLAALLILQGTAITSTPATDGKSAWNVVRDLKKALDKAKVPAGNRVFAANAEFTSLLLENDAKLMQADVSGTTAGLREAAIGRLLGFDSYSSENLPTTNKPQITAWWKPSLAYVSQIEKTEAMRADNKFADRLRGLHVYGGKLIRPTAAVSWTAA
ncbi:P22 phage major capsid protein family protein [Arthrobacter woluwensis]|uniref:P22 phage major capsid protein family protein n=1 Tax=Arthrobacter woluwensis TaxID=156980 RepID=UPI0011A25CF5|nr:P22 phage major capsid protein family protein [Arthrobacter woluwensis]